MIIIQRAKQDRTSNCVNIRISHLPQYVKFDQLTIIDNLDFQIKLFIQRHASLIHHIACELYIVILVMRLEIIHSLLGWRGSSA